MSTRFFLAAGALLMLLGAACWGAAVRHRHRVSAWWGALLPLGTAIYFGLAALALARIRSGKGVSWKGRMFTR